MLVVRLARAAASSERIEQVLAREADVHCAESVPTAQSRRETASAAGSGLRACQSSTIAADEREPVLKDVSFVGRAGADRCDPGRDRRGQIQPGQPHPAFLRCDRRPRDARRRRCARLRRSVAAPDRWALRCKRRCCSPAPSATTFAMAARTPATTKVIASRQDGAGARLHQPDFPMATTRSSASAA